ncbi:MAG: transporter substrate-binding domain-containing protein [Anaerolineae bacterium]|jgi:phosphate/phosphite/phosphonate ABC transporter binding protein|nr:transporter substrate-binding domain-containing protein [Anaerolineae bacterium]MBT7191023.1 transporter substrate-binding domain-containing protein [Anaerolineae bacterium]
MKKVSYMLFALLVIGAMVLAACTPAATPEPAPEPENPMDLGGREVTIAIENAYLPFNYIDPETGEGAGWDYEVWDEICSILNCTPVYVEAAWEGMIQAVADGQFDAAADGITITADRAEIVDFSMGYVAIEQRLLVRADEDRIEGIQSIVDDVELKLGTQTGTTNYETANKHLDADRIEAFEQFPFAVQALLAGDIDAVIMDETAGQGYLGENADSLKLVGDSLSSDELGFIYPLESDLVEPVDAALKEMMGNGFLEEVNAKFFGADFNVTYDDLFPPEPIGSEGHPIKVLFVPSTEVEVIVTGGQLMADALHEGTGLYFEVIVPTSYAATIEEMCASPEDTMAFIPGLGYALASQLCGIDVEFKAVRYGFPVYWAQYIVARDSEYQTLEDLEGATWGYTDASSTSGYMVPTVELANAGVTVGEAVETGGHNQAVKAVYNGEVDFATTYFSVPLSPDAGGGPWWSYEDYLAGNVGEDQYDIPDDVIDSCALNDDGKLFCGEWRPLDARPNIREEAPDVIQKVRILAVSAEVPNDTLSFGPDFPADLRTQIADALLAFAETETWAESIGNNDFYGWSGIIPATDAEYDMVRNMVEAVGLSLEGLGE